MTARLIIHGSRIPERFFATRRTAGGFTPVAIHIEAGRIVSVDQVSTAPAPTLDAEGCVALPGFVDLHIHGANGHDTMDADPPALAGIARFLARHGVTAFLPTTMTASHAETLAAVQAVAQAIHASAAGTGIPDVPISDAPILGARILGVHLEGPYLSPQYPGAQKSGAIRAPDLHELRAYLDAGPVRLVTLAPEQPGADGLIAEARARDVAVAIGHSAATYEESNAAFELGVRQTTHTYNAMPGLHHRQPGALGATLADDRVYAQLIADNIHVHPAAMRVLARCKPPEKLLLITDAIRATGLAPGRYDLGGQSVHVHDGACRLEDGTLAGSILTMEVALANYLGASGLPLGEVWPCAGLNALCALGLDRELGAIAPGYMADLVLLDEALSVVATLVGGEVAYLRDPERLTSA